VLVVKTARFVALVAVVGAILVYLLLSVWPGPVYVLSNPA
jgi:hypothetical protein